METQTEIFEDATSTSEKKKREFPSFKRNCDICGTEYDAKFPNARFCSSRCRKTNSRSMKKNTTTLGTVEIEVKKSNDRQEDDNVPSNLPVPAKSNALYNGLAPHMQIAVDMLRQDSQRWQNLYEEEKSRRKEVQAKHEDLKEKISRMEMDHKIEQIENKKPSGLSGLGENPFFLKILDHVGPALGVLASKMAESAGTTTPAMAGVEGQLDEVSQSQLANIAQWFAALPDATRAAVYDMLQSMAVIKEPQMLISTLQKIKILLTNGSTITTHNPMYGT